MFGWSEAIGGGSVLAIFIYEPIPESDYFYKMKYFWFCEFSEWAQLCSMFFHLTINNIIVHTLKAHNYNATFRNT